MKINIRNTFSCIALLSVMYSCKNNFPQDLDSFSLDMNFTQTEYTPVVGRNTVFARNFNSGESTLPLTFRISSVRTFDGKEAPELLKLFPVTTWKERYTGEEKSIEEIQAKRETMMRPLWEIGEHSGNLTMWSSSNSTILKTFPDSCYRFDIEVSSTGGRRYFKDLKLIPQKEMAYEPFSEDGSAPFIYSLVGDSTQTSIASNTIKVWFNRKGDGNALSFKFLDSKLNPIKLSKFATTDWDNLVHGFNKKFNADSTYLTYQVEYPIPLVTSTKTKYVNSSGYAFTTFSFDRINSYGIRLPNFIGLPFRIYEKGDWEIVFYFSGEAPLFN